MFLSAGNNNFRRLTKQNIFILEACFENGDDADDENPTTGQQDGTLVLNMRQ